MAEGLEQYGMTTMADGPDVMFVPDEKFTGMYKVGEEVAKATGVKGMSIVSEGDESQDNSATPNSEDLLAELGRAGLSNIESINEEAMWGPKEWPH